MNVRNLKLLEDKLLHLEEILKGYNSCAIAFSGGVDSSFLLAVANDVSKDKVIALTADSKAFPDRETEETREFCRERNIRQIVFQADVTDINSYSSNPKDRCYYCKHAIFSKMRDIALKNDCYILAEGSNTDDESDYRPGMRALLELGIKSPLREAGLCKEEIRLLSEQMGLKTAKKASFACLATRIPYGERITDKKLKNIEKAEDILRQTGLKQYRVRAHEISGMESEGLMARIEVLPEDFCIVMDEANRAGIVSGFKESGFSRVTLDLEGYQMGSMNVL